MVSGINAERNDGPCRVLSHGMRTDPGQVALLGLGGHALINRITFWQYLLTDHQAVTLREVGLLPGVKTTIVALSVSDPFRKAQGWGSTGTAGVELLTGGIWKVIQKGFLIVDQTPADIHVFNSLWGSRVQFLIFIYACVKRRRVAIISEPYSEVPYGYLCEEPYLLGVLKVFLRRYAYRLAGLLFRSRVKCVLAISRLACQQFIAAGFDNSLIFPYGYFVDARVPEISVRERKPGKILRFAYIGTLIKRKGYDIAINVFSAMIAEGNGMELDLYGMSEGKEWNADSFSGIRHCGLLPFGKTQAALTQYDAVVVPSRYDGWSVVVNEAIIAGTPIIVSRNVGASDLVATHRLGLVYDGTEAGLLNALREIVRAPHRLERWSQAERAFAPNIRPARAAQYLVDVLRFSIEGGVRPRCPWYQLGEES